MSLREALAENLDAAIAESQIQEAAPAVEPAAAEPAPVSAPAADDRPRGADGKFLPKQEAAPVSSAVAAAEPAPKRPAPQAWKKDFHGHWEKLEPTLQDYIEQREREASDGIGKHRGAYDRIKPFADAVQPYEPLLRQHGLDPVQHVGALLRAHQTLALGSPQEKLQMFQQLAQQYGVQWQPQGEQPAVDPTINWLTQELRRTQGMVQTWQTSQEQVAQATLQQEIDRFSKDPQYPHFEALKPAMAEYLNKGAAEDLPSAYKLALRMNDELFNQEHTRQREAQENEKRQAADAAAKKARAAAASPRSTSPSADMGRNSGKKSLRDSLSENFDAVEGRV